MAVSPLPRSAAAWAHVMNTSKKGIAGEKFISDVGLKEWSKLELRASVE